MSEVGETSEEFLGWTCLVLCIIIYLLAVLDDGHAASVFDHACGECDHVGECGDYECRPGVDGWKLKAGAR